MLTIGDFFSIPPRLALEPIGWERKRGGETIVEKSGITGRYSGNWGGGSKKLKCFFLPRFPAQKK